MGQQKLTRKVSELKAHREQAKVYGDGPDDELLDSIRKLGILQPLVVTKSNVIVSGHRRWCAARILKLKEVPVTLFGSENELDIREALIHFNRQRKKSKHQIACEAQTLHDVEFELAMRRKQEGQKKGGEVRQATRRGDSSLVSHDAPSSEDAGKARDKIAQALGIGNKTVDAAVKVGKAIKEAEETGDTEKAKQLKETTDRDGIVPTARRLAKPESKEKNKPAPLDRAQERLNKAIVKFNNALRGVRRDYEGLRAEIDKHNKGDSAVVACDVKLKLPKELGEVSVSTIDFSDIA